MKVTQEAPTKLHEVHLQSHITSFRQRKRAVSFNTHPSPVDWRNQMFYFLLPDRFSDGNETDKTLFDRNRPENHQVQDIASWRVSGTGFVGGKIAGITKRLNYLQELGVTTIWIGPVFKQPPSLATYHGYGIQNFLDVDPRYGTRQDLKKLVKTAHEKGMYVVLDIIYNHTGDNWYYKCNGEYASEMPYRFSPPYPVHGWRGESGNPIPKKKTLNINEGVWPEEFQNFEWYTRAGKISKWDPEEWENPMHPHNEFRRGDFYSMKDLDLENREVLSAVIKVYQYWIALTDCDGFRIDTVKHISWETSRNFCGAIKEFAESIGKNNFLLLGEVTGGASMAASYLELFGRNIDVALDIGKPSSLLAGMVKGFVDPAQFFEQFGGRDALGCHREIGRYHMSVLDDHDMVGRRKARFSAYNTIPAKYQQIAHAVGTQLTTLGIPCIYYGTEQAFDGNEDNDDMPAGQRNDEDRYIREAMFASGFGAFLTSGCHFFDVEHPTYLRIAAIAKLRNRNDMIGLALRRGRQYHRETALEQGDFIHHGAGQLTAWSRIMHQQEVLVVLNTCGSQDRTAYITVDADLHGGVNAKMEYIYLSSWKDYELKNTPANQKVSVLSWKNRKCIHLALPPAGMAILA